jgi:hypothetical protein
LAQGASISLTNFPTTDGRRLSVSISSSGLSVSLTLNGHLPSGQVLLQLPGFANNIVSTSSGTINQEAGTVTLAPRATSVTVQLHKVLPQ